MDAGLDAVVTRNPADFAACPLPVLTPQELLAMTGRRQALAELEPSFPRSPVLPELSNMLSWWQWAILAAVPPAIVLLYFLKLKRRPLEVPSTYLWHKSVEDLHVNSIWQRLRNNLLLYLQLAVVLFIVLALLRPSWQALRLSGSRLVLLIDNSASMQATDVKPSRLEEAKRRVGELIDQMHSGDSAMLISFSDTARVEQNFTDNRQQLREALAAIKPSQHSTNLSEALKLAAGLVNPGQANENSTDLQRGRNETLHLQRRPLPPGPEIRAGQPRADLRADRPFRRRQCGRRGLRREPLRGQKWQAPGLRPLAELRAGGGRGPAETLRQRPGPGDRRRPAQHPGGRDPRAGLRPAGDFDSGVLHLKAETGDQLAVDDEAWTVVNPPRRARVLLITPKTNAWNRSWPPRRRAKWPRSAWKTPISSRPRPTRTRSSWACGTS